MRDTGLTLKVQLVGLENALLHRAKLLELVNALSEALGEPAASEPVPFKEYRPAPGDPSVEEFVREEAVRLNVDIKGNPLAPRVRVEGCPMYVYVDGVRRYKPSAASIHRLVVWALSNEPGVSQPVDYTKANVLAHLSDDSDLPEVDA